ncbi:hypothetical protein N657DRAFT_30728 [Parathielavia appendiculata]|uniref:Secreted protein n=1 Tax=Parathielavia appendiculata TaxID=2587402 RepID=A0AAN6Z8V9_9PEZI|nr:hypothetical protein N657DRAFT_30728 [Parathielavia appendiculata]
MWILCAACLLCLQGPFLGNAEERVNGLHQWPYIHIACHFMTGDRSPPCAPSCSCPCPPLSQSSSPLVLTHAKESKLLR